MVANTPRRIAVVTDSTADLPSELLEKYSIDFIPLYLIMGDTTWLDRVDITPPKFYELLKTSSDFPKTSQPNISNFQDLFVRLSKETDGIVAILVSSVLSGTVASAQAARENLPDIPIEIIDSRGVSMMLGFPVLAAAQVARDGGDLQAVAEAARDCTGKAHIYFVVDSFEYLHRGGRVSAAAKWIGSSLNIKPVLSILEGAAKPVAQARTRRKALNKVFELLEKQLPAGRKTHMAVVNVAAAAEAEQIKAELVERFNPAEIILTDCSPVLGAHVGPGTVGIAFYAE